MLTKEELKQYNRQLILPELGINGQEKLKAAKVLMIGAGGLGCPVLQYLVAAGVGNIGIVDDDLVDASNLHRQILYSQADIGKAKAAIAKQKLQQLNPFVHLTAHQERVTHNNAAKLIDQYDLIIDGSDNFPTRYFVNDTCVALGKTLVFGSIFKFEGQVSVFNYQQGPNYRDVFPEAPVGNEVPNCSEIGVIGILPGIIGTYMANEAIKIICGFGEILSGKLLILNALDNSLSIFKIGVQNHAVIKPSTDESQPINQVDGEITLDILKHWLANTPEKMHLIDVREDYEFEEYNLGGENLSVYHLAEHISLFPPDKKLVFICQSGARSKMAVNIVKPHFKGEIYSVAGGIS
jgi:molybdopterin/thiamine biosynthesis adenylyltransferase/rhodanese-related sulfurtransferase